MPDNTDWISVAADRLAQFYDEDFGGKPRGRYRIADKLLRRLTCRRRLFEADIEALSRALLERGFILIDMDTFHVVMSANTFVNYRRVHESGVE